VARDRLRDHATPLQKCSNTGSARDFFPARLSLPQLREAAKSCRGCDLYCNATQAVFGEGPAGATIMFVGEQPGDQEDRTGRPFVGPAGAMLDEALEQAHIPRDQVYVTNAVKHFKFEPRGKKRIHSKPNSREINACRPWLEAEIQLVKPQILVALGATAAQSLMGSSFRLTQHRAQFIDNIPWAPHFLATMHPSALLRMPDEKLRHQAKADFLRDMKLIARQMRKARPA
jgi:uracil-DNA glycosylase family protein